MNLLLKSVRFFLSVFILNETKMSVFNNRRDNMRKRHIINRLDPLTAKKRRTRDVNIRRKRREKETIDNHSETRCENAICCQAAWQGQATLASRAGVAEAPVNKERSPEFLENVEEDLIKLRRGRQWGRRADWTQGACIPRQQRARSAIRQPQRVAYGTAYTCKLKKGKHK